MSRWLPWHVGWQRALYGPDGFYRRERPSDHFSTSTQLGPAFAAAVLDLVRRAGATSVVDLGAGSGELLGALRRLDPEIDLLGVDLRGRPARLPDSIHWSTALPERIEGVLVAHEYLDNVPCPVVQLDEHNTVRIVEVDVETGAERCGARADQEALAWLERWWPLGADPGVVEGGPVRAEVGLTRDRAWTDAVGCVVSGVALAVDYGHRRASRPPHGSLRGYRRGRATIAVADGSCDLTADVAVDAVAASVGASMCRQRDVLQTRGDGPPGYEDARADPVGAIRQLSTLGARSTLAAPGGLGDFWWLVAARGTADVGAWPA